MSQRILYDNIFQNYLSKTAKKFSIDLKISLKSFAS